MAIIDVRYKYFCENPDFIVLCLWIKLQNSLQLFVFIFNYTFLLV